MTVKLLLIALGGAVGAVSRFAIGRGLHHVLGDAFPYGTLAVNVLGCFLLGALFGLRTHEFSQNVHEGITFGFLGALTTFSTFGFETVKYSKDVSWVVGAGNVAANVLLGLLAVKLGISLGEYLRS
ncbi:MAG: CrcB family protein [Pirellulaceae bacterium]